MHGAHGVHGGMQSLAWAHGRNGGSVVAVQRTGCMGAEGQVVMHGAHGTHGVHGGSGSYREVTGVIRWGKDERMTAAWLRRGRGVGGRPPEIWQWKEDRQHEVGAWP